jgi:hypothetical protein
VGHKACIKKIKIHKILIVKPEKDNFGDIYVDVPVILKWNF